VATVTEGEGVAGLAMVSAGGGPSLYVVPGQPISGANRIFSAQVASGPGIRTSIRLVNASAQERTVTLRLVSEEEAAGGAATAIAEGDRPLERGRLVRTGIADVPSALRPAESTAISTGSIAAPVTLTLAAGRLFEGEIGSLFELDSAHLAAASLDVTADAGGILGDVVVYKPGIPGMGYASELALDNRLARRAFFGYVANGPGIFTGLAFYNPEGDNAEVTVEVYSEDGVMKGKTSFQLRAGARLARTVPELIPAAAGWSRGYISIRSTAPLALQELFVDERLQYLSTVPAVILE